MGHPTYQVRVKCGHSWAAGFLALGLAASFAPRAGYALLIAGAAANTDGTGIYGFDAVGLAGQSSGVYLGNGWVLTARHSAATDFWLNGTYYPNVYANPSVITITNPANGPGYAGQAADLILYRVGVANQAAPVATPIALPTASPGAGTPFNMVGLGGWAPTLNSQYWVVSPPTQPASWHWTALTGPAAANVAGYAYDPNAITSGVRRWGTNATDNAFYDTSYKHYTQIPVAGPGSAVTFVNTSSFFNGFSTSTGQPTGGTQYEAAAYYGDSGGGAFTASQLIGTILYQDSLGDGLNGQPANTLLVSPTNLTPTTAGRMHQTTATYYADLSVYAAEILSDAGISEWGSPSGGSWTAATWGSYAYGTTTAPNAAATTADFLGAITAPRTITVSSTVTVGTINLSNTNAYTLAGAGGSIVLDNSFNGAAFPAEINTFIGNHTISATLTLHSDLVVTTAAGGGLTLSGVIGADGIRRALTKAGAGTLTLLAANTYSGGTVVNGGTLVLGNTAALGTGPLTLTSGTVKVQDSLTATGPIVLAGAVFGSGTLDLRNNCMVIKSTTDVSAALRDQVIGGAITTTYTHRDGGGASGPATTLGYLTGAYYIAMHGNTLPGYTGLLGSNDIVLQWTYPGDLDLSGYVDSRDYALLDAGYLGGYDGIHKIATWGDGDVNHDGKITALDFQALDASLLAEGNTTLAESMITLHSAMFGAAYSDGVSALLAPTAPEPASLAFLAGGALLLVRPRRRFPTRNASGAAPSSRPA